MAAAKLPRRNRYSREIVAQVDSWLQTQGMDLLCHAAHTNPLANIAGELQAKYGVPFRANFIGRRLRKLWPLGLCGWRGQAVTLAEFGAGLTGAEWAQLRCAVEGLRRVWTPTRPRLQSLAVAAWLQGCPCASVRAVQEIVTAEEERLWPLTRVS